MYQPHGVSGDPITSEVPKMEVLSLKNSNGDEINSWYQRAQGDNPTIVYFQGNAGSIKDRAFKAKILINEGFGILLVGYRGFGGNKGNPTEQGLYNDAYLAISFLIKNNIRHNQIILYGESLGSGIAVEMASRFSSKTPVAGMILEAPFSSMMDAAKKIYPYVPVSLLLKDRYDSLSKISRINTALLIFHGNEDKTIPIELGKKLFFKAKEPKLGIWVDGANHGNLFQFDIEQTLINFIKTSAFKGYIGNNKNLKD